MKAEKECPLCGRGTSIYSVPRSGKPFMPNKDMWVIQCSCGLSLSRTRKYNVVKAWNRRTIKGEQE